MLKSQWLAWAALALALLLPWLFIWQGLDVTDQGYLLTIYRQFLHHPEAVSQAAHMWLTNVVGGLWDALFGSLGVVAHRAQWALCLSLGLYLGFRALRELTSPIAAATSVLAASAFLVDRRETWFSYNVLTALINALAVVAMARGLCGGKRRLLWLSGVLIGVSPFARFPNVLGVVLLSGPVFLALIERDRRKTLLSDLVPVVGGAAAGVAGALLLIKLSGCWSVYSESLAGLFAPSVAKTGHGTSSLIRLFVFDQGWALAAGVGSCVALGVVHLLGRAVPRGARLLGFLALAVLCATHLDRLEHGKDPERWRFFIVGICYVGLLAFAFGLGKRALELRMLCYLGAVALLVTPLGSDQGTRNAHWGLWFALPCLIATVATTDLETWGSLTDLAFVLGIVVLGDGIQRARSYTYRDHTRDELTHAAEHPQLRWQFTTAERAKVLREVLPALQARVAPGDYLLTSESIPLMQYLTSTRPYLSIPWIMVDEDPAELRRLLQEVPRKRGCVPVMVRALGNARSPNWPYDASRGLDRRHAEARKLINKFLKQHQYQSTWHNEFFEIVQPAPGGVVNTKPCR